MCRIPKGLQGIKILALISNQIHQSTVKTEDCHRIFASLRDPKPLNLVSRNWCKSIGQTHNSPKIPKGLFQRDFAIEKCGKRWALDSESKPHIKHILADTAVRGLHFWNMPLALILLRIAVQIKALTFEGD